MKIKLTLIAICFFAVSLTKAKAQMGDPPPMDITPDAASLKAAEEMLLAQHMDVQIRQNLYDVFNRSGANVAKEKRAKFFEVMKNALDKYCTWDILKGQIIQIYAETYTLDELKQLNTFYRTPLGQLVAKNQIALSQQVSALIVKPLTDHQKEIGEAFNN